MAVKKGDKVKVDYTGTLDDGTVFDSSQHGDHSHPLEFEAGSGMVIKGFDDAVMGMNKGQEKTFKIKPEEAYGNHNPALIQRIPLDKFPKAKELKKGQMLALVGKDGQQFGAKVTELNDKEATLDLNHPLAGKTLNFKIKLVEISS